MTRFWRVFWALVIGAPIVALAVWGVQDNPRLFVVTFLDAAIHQYYFFWTGRYLEAVGIPGNWVMPVMSIGQIAEIATMAFLGYVLKSLGWRATMIVGILGHAARFAVFAYLRA